MIASGGVPAKYVPVWPSVLYCLPTARLRRTPEALRRSFHLASITSSPSFIVLMGAEFDSEMERQAKHDPQPEDAKNDPLMEDAKAEAGKPAAQS